MLSRSFVSDPMDCSPPGSSVHGDSPGENTGVGCHALLQGIFPTQRSNSDLLPCWRILYCLSHQGRWGQWLGPSWQSRGAGGWLHQGDEDSDRGCVMGPLLVGCLCSQECGGSNPHLLSGPSVVAEGSPYYPMCCTVLSHSVMPSSF